MGLNLWGWLDSLHQLDVVTINIGAIRASHAKLLLGGKCRLANPLGIIILVVLTDISKQNDSLRQDNSYHALVSCKVVGHVLAILVFISATEFILRARCDHSSVVQRPMFVQRVLDSLGRGGSESFLVRGLQSSDWTARE